MNIAFSPLMSTCSSKIQTFFFSFLLNLEHNPRVVQKIFQGDGDGDGSPLCNCFRGFRSFRGFSPGQKRKTQKRNPRFQKKNVTVDLS